MINVCKTIGRHVVLQQNTRAKTVFAGSLTRSLGHSKGTPGEAAKPDSHASTAWEERGEFSATFPIFQYPDIALSQPDIPISPYPDIPISNAPSRYPDIQVSNAPTRYPDIEIPGCRDIGISGWRIAISDPAMGPILLALDQNYLHYPSHPAIGRKPL